MFCVGSEAANTERTKSFSEGCGAEPACGAVTVQGGESDICVNFSGLPLCKAGVWGMQSPKISFFLLFSRLRREKRRKKPGLGLPPKAMKPLR
jgi:hypothetical protein